MVTVDPLLSAEQLKLCQSVAFSASVLELPVYLVGGVVRDMLLGGSLEGKDLDFVIEGDAIKLARVCAQALEGELREFPDFMTAKIISPKACPGVCGIDFASSRKELYPKPGSLPLVEPAGIREDLRRRDFSINAIALPLGDFLKWQAEGKGELRVLENYALDLFKGVEDMKNRLIRILHERSFLDDPTRIFRACRYAARLSAVIEPQTKKLLQAALGAEALNTVSYFRKFTELRKICSERSWFKAIQSLGQFGVFEKMGLCCPGHSEKVLTKLAALAAKQPELCEEDLFALLLKIFYYDWPERERGPRFRSFGFGKKFMNKMKLLNSRFEHGKGR